MDIKEILKMSDSEIHKYYENRDTKIKQCITCKYFEQQISSNCASPKQNDEDLKGYCYYNFSCDLHEKGIHQTRINYMRLAESENAT